MISWLAPEEATSLSMKVGQLHSYQICQDGLEVPTSYRVQMIEAKQQFEIGLYGDDFKWVVDFVIVALFDLISLGKLL